MDTLCNTYTTKVCWSVIGSGSQMLVDSQKLIAPVEFGCFTSIFKHFLHAPCMSMKQNA